MMNQPPEQITRFHENHRERVGQNRASQMALFEPPPPSPRDWVASKAGQPIDTATRAGEYSEGHDAPRQSFDPHRTHQLAMFMTPHEIQTHYSPLEGDRMDMDRWDDISDDDDDYADVETDEELWDRKAEEADEQGLTESIAKHGVLSPVQLAFSDKPGPRGVPEVLGGHHRVAAAPPHSLVPVLHYNDIWHARQDKAYPYERSVRDVDPTYGHHSEPGVQTGIAAEHGIDLGYRHHPVLESDAGTTQTGSQQHPWIRNSRIPW